MGKNTHAGLGKIYLCNDEHVLVTRYHISCVVGKFEREGVLDHDNATGFPGLLHRLGVMRDKVNRWMSLLILHLITKMVIVSEHWRLYRTRVSCGLRILKGVDDDMDFGK